jgi:pimeloyl-ACP methyl ester carboxylesterase
MLHAIETFSINGAQIYVERQGDGHPLILLHAGIADCRQWDEQFEAFAQSYSVIRYDHRGWGRSDAPAGPVAFHEDLYGVLRALDVERAHVLGISMGGTFALDFAVTHPEMVSSLILVGSWLSGFNAPTSDAEQAVWAAIESAVNDGQLDRANELEVDLKLAGIYRDAEMVNPRVRDRLRRLHRPAFDRLSEREEMRPWLKPTPPTAERLREITAPALVVYGDLDVPAVPLIASRLSSELQNAQTVVMRGVAHVPNMEQPEEFNRIVLAFLQRVSRA